MGLCLSKKTKGKPENEVKEVGASPPVSQLLEGKSPTHPDPEEEAKTVKGGTCGGQKLFPDASSNLQQPQLQHQQATAKVETHHQQLLLLGTLAPSHFASADCGAPGSPLDPTRVATPLRASSCTKEEVESILIQCGRLSRSSSASTDRHRRKRSNDLDTTEVVSLENGHGQRSGGDGGSSSSRPSPRRRRARSREKRSESNERGNGCGGRRVSQSPGRRAISEGISAGAAAGSPCSSSSNAEIPVKMVAVPAREKGAVAASVAAFEGGSCVVTGKRAPAAAAALTAAPRSASPQSRSAALTTHSSAAPRSASPQSRSVQVVVVAADSAASTLSRRARSASARSRSPACTRPGSDENALHASLQTAKAEQHRRRSPSPMREIDGNRLGQEWQQKNKPNEQKGDDSVSGDPSKANNINSAEGARRVTTGQPGPETKVNATESKENTAAAAISPAVSNPRVYPPNPAPSTRSSSDLDDANTEATANLNPQPTYASMLLRDIQDYHHKQQNHHPQPPSSTTTVHPALHLPACVSKARSILDAVADLKSPDTLSGSCDGFSSNWHASLKGPARRGDGGPVNPGAAATPDFLWDPRARRYVSVRESSSAKLVGAATEDVEPQESAGSNSFVWGPDWEPGSADCSSSRCWASASPSCSVEHGEEVDGGRDVLPPSCASPPALGRPRQPFLTAGRDEKHGGGSRTENGQSTHDSRVRRAAGGGSSGLSGTVRVGRAATGSSHVH